MTELSGRIKRQAATRQRSPMHQAQKASIAMPLMSGTQNFLYGHGARLPFSATANELFHGFLFVFKGCLFRRCQCRNHMSNRLATPGNGYGCAVFDFAQKFCQASFGFAGLDGMHCGIEEYAMGREIRNYFTVNAGVWHIPRGAARNTSGLLAPDAGNS